LWPTCRCASAALGFLTPTRCRRRRSYGAGSTCSSKAEAGLRFLVVSRSSWSGIRPRAAASPRQSSVASPRPRAITVAERIEEVASSVALTTRSASRISSTAWRRAVSASPAISAARPRVFRCDRGLDCPRSSPSARCGRPGARAAPEALEGRRDPLQELLELAALVGRCEPKDRGGAASLDEGDDLVGDRGR